jgi:membrane-associated protease RseP (regulator of RpoE activity)
MAAVRRTLIHKEPKFLMIIALILSIFFWPHVSIFCHELGHFVCAKLVGMSPRLMKVGSGFGISSNRFFGARIELGILPFPIEGETRAHFPTSWSTLREWTEI